MAAKDEIVPRAVGAKKGSKGADVTRLQNYLRAFGYLDSDRLDDFGVGRELAAPQPEQGTFDDFTEEALQTFQARYGLPVTGVVDAATLALLEKPRCGFPDTAEFVAQGNKWTTNDLRYGFIEFTGDLTQAQARTAVATALGYWAAVTPLTFTEVPNANDPDIRIRFVAGDHQDGSPFDGASGVLAHAYYPPPNGGDIAGDAHFDEAETWSVDLPASGTDLYTVAAHEFGHSLGLAHSTVSGALMYPYYGGPHRFLSDDDIAGIQSIYGGSPWITATLDSVYATPHSKNAWAYPHGVGWRKIQPLTADGVSNVFATLVRARAAGSAVTLHVTGNEIDTVYL
ncbi:matrixin family metalloprotease [Microbacterium ulmi]|uniref:Matrixin family metalloprotease n=1 Tax=Microbacterium ulmi TaxID=179095 RepID=A0A7Y2Q1N2_9MICO|nr:matrixin family metalloprotease [Microbacterium ulmi]NII70654.1 hypothetical protein [Microbacterium ulmi]NNH04105.1 matrixin family metalloprotease [Microbacterium ulmi]